MCGIFGFIFSNQNEITNFQLSHLINTLFLLSESRGKEAAGLAVSTPDSLNVIKSPISASHFIKTQAYKDFLTRNFTEINKPINGEKSPSVFIGHSRLVTNGGQQINSNNQPAISNGMVAIHNGIITNDDALWQKNRAFIRETQLDTEVFLKIFDDSIKSNQSYSLSLSNTYSQIEGVASVAVLFNDATDLLLATNNGSLYFVENPDTGAIVFTSEKYILSTALKREKWLRDFGLVQVKQLFPNNGILVKYEKFKSIHFSFADPNNFVITRNNQNNTKPIQDYSANKNNLAHQIRTAGEGPYFLPENFDDAFPKASQAVSALRRCTKCILPETMPFIEFDEAGVCNYCRYEELNQPLGLDALEKIVAPYRKGNGEPECLVTFSGGRDSSYGVHFVSEILKMKPVTYTYDWGMVTDLARRNQMRICGKLGLEHILVSANLARKRNNIRLNISSWLRSPDLGTIPLFMAGDKQYFYYANQVGKQTGCKLIILCENLLETTRFKTGYCGISPHFGSTNTYSLKLSDKFKLLKYYGNSFITNPKYINSSLIDTFGAYLSYYFMPHNYLNLYQYIQWDESIINKTLIETYNWETAKDTKSTWRIGDGTASFYNYIYYIMAGFTENDTFRSNQIRAGIINRDQAIAFVNEENQPRYNSIQWYCDIIGLDFLSTIQTINSAPRLYNLE